MDELGWAGRVMTWLRAVTDLVALNLLWLVGAVLGLVVLGVGPATAAASPLLDAILRGRPSDELLRDFWRGYRTGWLRANTLAAPLWAVAVVALADLVALRAASGGVVTALAVGLGAVGMYAVAAAAFLYPVDERSRAAGSGTVRHTLRVTLLSPALFPGTAVAVLVTVALVAWLLWTAPVLVPLVGVSLPLALTGRLARRRLHALDAGPSGEAGGVAGREAGQAGTTEPGTAAAGRAGRL